MPVPPRWIFRIRPKRHSRYYFTVELYPTLTAFRARDVQLLRQDYQGHEQQWLDWIMGHTRGGPPAE